MTALLTVGILASVTASVMSEGQPNHRIFCLLRLARRGWHTSLEGWPIRLGAFILAYQRTVLETPRHERLGAWSAEGRDPLCLRAAVA